MRQERIQKKLSDLSPVFLDIQNESHNHSVPKNSETHFKVIVVSEEFKNKSRIRRQRIVNDLLKPEFENGLHALTMRLYTPEEWENSDEGKSFQSPNCHGGSKP